MSIPPLQLSTDQSGTNLASDVVDATDDANRFSWAPFLWFTPAILILFLVTLYPTIFVIWLSFQKTKYYELVGFAGLANYVEVLSSSEFWDTTVISLTYVGASRPAPR